MNCWKIWFVAVAAALATGSARCRAEELSPDEEKAVRAYSGIAIYRMLNEFNSLTPEKQSSHPLYGRNPAHWERLSTLLDSALTKLPAHIGRTYRFTRLTTKQLEAFQEHKPYSDPRHLSTTLRADYDAGAWKEGEGECVRIIVDGKSGRSIGRFAVMAGEAEVLFRRRTHFSEVKYKVPRTDNQGRAHIEILLAE